jgi:HPt (histidine-containing phosphotransfer) domain-containing protein
LADSFQSDTRSGLQEVDETLQTGDAPAVERVAHKLKGGLGGMGQGECPASARNRKTSAHQEVSRQVPNF